MLSQLEKVQVRCPGCGWSGGRSVRDPLARPCFRCQGPVQVEGEPYVEQRVWVGCRACVRGHNRVGPQVGTCKRCGSELEPAYLVLGDGTVLAS